MMKNITVILCDALRSDHITPRITPNLVDILNENVSYECCLAGNTSTIKSMPWLLCGEPKYLPGVSIMSRLRRMEYKSIILSANALVDREFYRGWDIHESMNAGEGIDKQFNKRKYLRRLLPDWFTYNVLKPLYRQMMDPDSYLVFKRAEEVLDRASKLIKTEEKPLFTWIHLMEPHHPYYPKEILEEDEDNRRELIQLNDKLIDAMRDRYKPSFVEGYALKNLYKQEVSYMDKEIQKFYERNNKETILIITSDHGEEFGEKGQWGHHEDKFIPELQNVPLIIVNGEEGKIPGNFHHKLFPDLVEHISKGGSLFDS